MKRKLYTLLVRFIPLFFFVFQHYRIHKKYGNHSYLAKVSKPRTFNEKTIYSKLSNQHKVLYPLVDKEEVKHLVEKVIGSVYIIPTQLVIKSQLNNKHINKLKPPFIMKPAHLSGTTFIVENFDKFNIEKVNKWISSCLGSNLYITSGESQYEGVQPKIIIENSLGADLLDYKLFCFHGKVHFVQVDHNRHTYHTRSFYTPEWNKLNFSTLYPMEKEEIESPQNLPELIEVAEKLAKPFDFVRVDLYDTAGQVFFGELTFHHGSGYEPFTTYEDDLHFGNLWKSFYKYDKHTIEKLITG